MSERERMVEYVRGLALQANARARAIGTRARPINRKYHEAQACAYKIVADAIASGEHEVKG